MHRLEDEVKRCRIRDDVEIIHLSKDVEQLSRGGSDHEVSPKVVIVEVNIRHVRLPILVERPHPSFKQILDLIPFLRRHVFTEQVLKLEGVVGFRQCGAAGVAEGGDGAGGGGGAWIGVPPILAVKRAAGGGIGRERGGGGVGVRGGFGELGFLREEWECGDGTDGGGFGEKEARSMEDRHL